MGSCSAVGLTGAKRSLLAAHLEFRKSVHDEVRREAGIDLVRLPWMVVLQGHSIRIAARLAGNSDQHQLML